MDVALEKRPPWSVDINEPGSVERTPPWSVDINEPGAAERAATSLTINGFCALRGPIVPADMCERCAAAVYGRLDTLLHAASSRGLDVDAGLLRFNEVCKRHHAARYDLRLPLGRATALVPQDAASVEGAQSWIDIKPLVDMVVQPIVSRAFDEENAPQDDWAADAWSTEVAGCVVSLPGASVQASHADGTSPALVNAFVPLVAVDARNGTEIQPGSHLDTHGMPTDALAPLPHGVVPSLDAGDLLLFHYRAVHRGLANASASARPVLYFTYGADGAVDTHNFPTDEPLLNERGSA